MNWSELELVFGISAVLWMMAGGCAAAFIAEKKPAWGASGVIFLLSVLAVLFLGTIASAALCPRG